MAAITGQPAPKPGQVGKPVPTSEAKDDLTSLLESARIDLPATEESSPTSVGTEASALESAELPDEVSPAGTEMNDMSPLPAPEGWASIMEQIDESKTRLKNSFAVTNAESIQVLKDSGLFGDARIGDNGNVQVKRRGRQGWEDFDRDKFELIGDTLDFARDAFEGVIENASRIGGFGAGVAVTAPKGVALGVPAGPVGMTAGAVATGLAGGVPGAISGGATGAVAAKNAGDIVAEKLFGITPDPSRNFAVENATAAAFGAGFSFFGSRLARRAAEKRAAKIEAKKTIEYAKQQADEATSLIKEVQDSGIKLSPEGRFHLDPQQLVGGGNIPDLDVTARELSRQQGFQNFRREQGNMIAQAYDSIGQSLASAAGRASEIGSDFVLSAKDIRKAEGTLIESFRKQASEELAGKALPAQRSVQTVMETFSQMGGAIRQIPSSDGKMQTRIIAPPPEVILREFPSLTSAQAKSLSGEVNSLALRLKKSNGQLTVDQASEIYKSLSGKIDRSINSASGRPYAMALVKLKNAVRDDWTDMMGQVLPDAQKAAYAKSKARYSDIMQSTEQLSNLLQTENISRSALVSNLFEGKNSLKMARGAKTLIQESNPGLWQDLTSEYVKKLRLDHIDPLTGKTNWGGMSKKWSGLGPEMQQEILDGSGIKKEAMSALIGIGTRYQGTDFGALPQSTKRGVFKSLFGLLGPTMATTKGDSATSLLEGIGSKQSMMVWLKDGGLEETLKQLPGLKPDVAQRLRSWIVDWQPTPMQKVTAPISEFIAREAKGAGEKTPRALKETVKGIPRTYLRRSAEEGSFDR